jgi:hypothetical protein
VFRVIPNDDEGKARRESNRPVREAECRSGRYRLFCLSGGSENLMGIGNKERLRATEAYERDIRDLKPLSSEWWARVNAWFAFSKKTGLPSVRKSVSRKQVAADWVPIPAAAAELSVTRQQIYALIKAKRLRLGMIVWGDGSYKVNWVTRKSLERYKRERFTGTTKRRALSKGDSP